MNNFSDVTATFQDLPTVAGVLLIDSDGLTLASSFADQHAHIAISPAIHSLLNDTFKNLSLIGETANQVCIVQDRHIIIAQPVYDVILVVYTQKNGLDLLQSRFSSAIKILQRIVAPDFSNN
jgi:predicted regulator of Ras-like GTPase activity (Roadblock/LC7/MglB family)